MVDYSSFIEINPKVMLGKPVIKDTRLTVEFILEELSVGREIKDLIESHPKLNKEGVQAALAYAAASMRNEAIYPITI